ncbi:hypothetical protein [Paludibacterium sp.]|uniref:hypothetical protein n=1 Tax=Paludibacterium sp. TaxID=1917523 RepID=UPI0025FEAD1F|nr:hypothetical protein [Paludibacterium sp.]MBV8649614.1 hypothetical protein [Paludibacterium sp.]
MTIASERSQSEIIAAARNVVFEIDSVLRNESGYTHQRSRIAKIWNDGGLSLYRRATRCATIKNDYVEALTFFAYSAKNGHHDLGFLRQICNATVGGRA